MPDIKSLIQQLTLEEKAALTIGATPWLTVPVERLGIPSIWVSDGPHGIRKVPQGMGEHGLPATCFPTAAAMASTWDREVVAEVAQALADECIALEVDVILGPGNNMKRTPLCGRNFEYFSEDPFLGGEMAAAYINGMQNRGVGTSLKHYAANSQEYQRMTINAEVDERTLREIYLAGFERAVKQAKPWTVMCSYNRLNGTYASQHHWLLTEVLKDEWGYEGVVVSDWGAVHDRVAALVAGLDLEMPGPQEHRRQRVIEAVQSGQLDEAVLDDAVERILKIVFKARETPKGGTTINIDAHHALARRVAAEAIVLLKNDGHILPLGGQKTIAVIGGSAKEPSFQGGGSSKITATRVDIPYDELQKLAGGAELIYAEGYAANEGIDYALIDQAVDAAARADVALLYIALPFETEGEDRPHIDLTPQQIALIQAVCARQPKSVVILNNGSAVAMKDWIDGPAAVLTAWTMGQAGGGAIADVLFGQVNPSGRLAETFPLRLCDTPAYLNYPGDAGKVRYGEGLFIGYRYYDQKQAEVLFPFGFGLSYTTFDFSNLRVSSETFKDTDGLQVSVDVTNTGKRAGKATVQLYVRDQESKLTRPYKELKGFAKVALQPGETKTATMTLDMRAFAYYHPGYHQWVTESGAFDILIGESAADLRLQKTVTLESSMILPSLLTRDSSLREWFENPRGAAVLGPLMQQMMAHMAAHGVGEEIPDEIPAWVQDIPLEAMLMYWGSSLPKAPEEMLGDLLAQANG